MVDLQSGQYEGRITDYGISTTKDGRPQVVISFLIENEQGGSVTKTWFGSLKTDAQPGKKCGKDITDDQLEKIGFKRGRPYRDLVDGPNGGALDTNKKVPVTIVVEQDQNGQPQSRLKWIGGGGGGPQKLQRNDALAALERAGLGSGEPTAKAPDEMTDVPF